MFCCDCNLETWTSLQSLYSQFQIIDVFLDHLTLFQEVVFNACTRMYFYILPNVTLHFVPSRTMSYGI